MPRNILITGAFNGIGALTGRALAGAGHTVYDAAKQARAHAVCRPALVFGVHGRCGVR